jgi:hypothetical protein
MVCGGLHCPSSLRPQRPLQSGDQHSRVEGVAPMSRLRVYHRVGAGRPIRVVWAGAVLSIARAIRWAGCRCLRTSKARCSSPPRSCFTSPSSTRRPGCCRLPPRMSARSCNDRTRGARDRELPPTRGEPRGIGEGGRALRGRGRRARGRAVGDASVPRWLPVQCRRQPGGVLGVAVRVGAIEPSPTSAAYMESLAARPAWQRVSSKLGSRGPV